MAGVQVNPAAASATKPEKHPRLTRGAQTGLSDGGDARTDTAETPFWHRGKLCRYFREADEMRFFSPSIYL